MATFFERLEKFMNRFGRQPSRAELVGAVNQNEYNGDGANTIGWDWLNNYGIKQDTNGNEITDRWATYCGDTLCDLGRIVIANEEEEKKKMQKMPRVKFITQVQGGKTLEVENYCIRNQEDFALAKKLDLLEGAYGMDLGRLVKKYVGKSIIVLHDNGTWQTIPFDSPNFVEFVTV